MEKTVAQYIEKNICEVRRLTALGIFPLSLLSNYRLYLIYKNTEYLSSSKMDRYTFVAEEEKVNERSVMRAVYKMESKL